MTRLDSKSSTITDGSNVGSPLGVKPDKSVRSDSTSEAKLATMSGSGVVGRRVGKTGLFIPVRSPLINASTGLMADSVGSMML